MSTADGWMRPAVHPVLGRAEVHVWRASLDVDADTLAAFTKTLALDERARADRLVTPVLRDRFVAGRGLQRDILARYLGVAPGSLGFSAGPQGKPRLDHTQARGLCFNASNAGGLALVAVALEREIGVDVEALRPVPDAGALVERFFAPGEARAFRALPEGVRARAFLRAWTRKEAYLKATGAGLFTPLSRFEVTVDENEPPRLLSVDDDADAAARWTLRDLDPSPEHVGALAMDGHEPQVRLFAWAG